MNSWRAVALASALGLPLLSLQSASGQGGPALTEAAAEPSVRPGTRTVCLGQRRDGVRTVGCFDVYRLEIGPIFDPVKNTELSQYVWKWTAEAEGGEGHRLVRLLAEVNSEAGTTYNWSPGASIEVKEPQMMRASMQTDIVAESAGDGGPPKLADASDGWAYRGLSGWIHPRLEDQRFVTLWLAPDGKTAPRGEAAQVAGATVWGAPAPGPELLPARLRLAVTYR